MWRPLCATSIRSRLPDRRRRADVQADRQGSRPDRACIERAPSQGPVALRPCYRGIPGGVRDRVDRVRVGAPRFGAAPEDRDHEGTDSGVEIVVRETARQGAAAFRRGSGLRKSCRGATLAYETDEFGLQHLQVHGFALEGHAPRYFGRQIAQANLPLLLGSQQTPLVDGGDPGHRRVRGGDCGRDDRTQFNLSPMRGQSCRSLGLFSGLRSCRSKRHRAPRVPLPSLSNRPEAPSGSCGAKPELSIAAT